jgi:predicted O-linked N-acetylglucosamine transferase (SPINDLY family)
MATAFDAAWRHYQAGEFPQAERLCRQIVQADADHAEARHLLGLIAALTGRDDLAFDQLGAAIRLRPDFADAHNVLGILLAGNRRPAEAAASFQEAIRLRPDFAEAYNNLGSLLLKHDRLDEAEAVLREALRLRPDFAEIAFNLGFVLAKQERIEEAIACNRRAVQLRPDHAEAHANLAHGLMERAHLDEAIAEYRVALRLRPDAAQVHSNLVRVLQYHPGYDPSAIAEECRRWNAQHAEPLRGEIRPHDNNRDPDRRLRVGYVSSEFRDHADSFFTVPLLSRHDHDAFEVFGYAEVARPDALTDRLRGYADVWRDIAGLSDSQVAELLRRDGIDILVDLRLHTADNRLLVFARKPAPVQVSWLGYPGTTGLSTIDYRLTDPYLDPPGMFDAFYSEESVRLPDTFWCYDPLTDEPAVGPLPALESGAVTFGCLNAFCKVNGRTLALWARVLRAVPGSRLLMRAPQGPARDEVLARLQREEIEAARVAFVDKRTRPEYLRLYHRIDLCLDPLPYNGHTTSLDGFWMGVPTLTMPGRTAAGRAGWSQLCNLGLKELAAETPEDFAAMAAGLAGDLPRLRELRRTLRERMSQSPLMDAGRFARNVEAAYRAMWHRWCEDRGR